MYTLRVKAHFDAAHQLTDYVGKCSRLHGHRWLVEIYIQGKELGECNMLADFGDVKRELTELFDKWLDHYPINEQLGEANPTAEFLAKWIYDRFLLVYFGGRKLDIVRTVVWESPDCSVEYRGD